MTAPGVFDGVTSEDGIRGVVPAIVVDNDPKRDKRGDVGVTYPFQKGDEAYWARMSTPETGDGYGSYFLPKVDTEVLVAFEHGDIHKPYIVGGLWNGKQKPPHKNEGENRFRGFTTPSKHQLTFEDDKEKEDGSITIQTSGGHEIIIDDSKNKETIMIRDKDKKNSITLDAESDTISVEATKDLNLSAQNVTIEGKQNVEISGGTKVDISGNQAAVSGNSTVDIKSSGIMNVEAKGPNTIKGLPINLNP